MTKHLFSLRNGKTRVLFAGDASDTEFEGIKAHFNGVLPIELVVTHIEDDENVDNSPRVQALAKLPRAKQVTYSPFTGQIVCDVHYTQMLKEDYGYAAG